MYHADIENMANRVINAGLVAQERKQQLVDALASYWTDRIADIWTVADIKDVWADLTDEQARDMLDKALRHLDTDYGINWTVLEKYLPADYIDIQEEEDEETES